MLPQASITHQDGNKVVLDLVIPNDFDAFDGHFPSQPILPGVVQLDWAVRFAGMYFDLKNPTAQDIQIKFKDIIVPDTLLSLSLEYVAENKKLIFTYSAADVSKATGRIILSS